MLGKSAHGWWPATRQPLAIPALQGRQSNSEEGWSMKKVLIVGVLLLGAAAAALSVTALQATTGGGNRIVRSVGSETFRPNARIASNLRFIPGDIQIRSGGTLKCQHHDSTQEPHTRSIVARAALPGDT